MASLAVLCLASGIAIGALISWKNIWCASFIRSGALLGALWIGMPTRGRAAAWANINPSWIVLTAAALLLMSRRLYLFLPLLAALLVLGVILPRMLGQRPR